jgi:hypothetical protein
MKGGATDESPAMDGFAAIRANEPARRAEAAAIAAGLSVLGRVAALPEDALPPLPDGRPIGVLLLLGWRGAENWSTFAASAEMRDGRPDPLDRWSKRVIGGIAADLGLVALHPFEGPPWWPFQRWAMRTGHVSASPIGLGLDSEVGLWHAHRGALGLPKGVFLPAVESRPSPCESCRERPCLSTCPVEAFTASGHVVERCRAHLLAPEGRLCREEGCRARLACPIGREHRYAAPQIRFLMAAFVRFLDHWSAERPSGPAEETR